MFLLKSEDELTQAFQYRPTERIDLPKDVRFPLVVREYLAWTDPGGLRVYLVFAEPEARKPIGVVFDRESSSGPTAAICEWCHSHGSTSQIGLLTVAASSKRRVGVHLCLDLSCRDKIEANLSLSPRAAQDRVRRVVEAMARFSRRTLL